MKMLYLEIMQRNVTWPSDMPILAPKDAIAPTLSEIPSDQLPVYSTASP
jgi:hypothetical protein